MGVAEQMGFFGDEEDPQQGPDGWKPADADGRKTFADRVDATMQRLKQGMSSIRTAAQVPTDADQALLAEMDRQIAQALKDLAHDSIAAATEHEAASLGYHT